MPALDKSEYKEIMFEDYKYEGVGEEEEK